MAGVSVRKRGKGWEYRFYGAIVDGKRQRIEKMGFRTKKEAQTAGAKALAEYNNVGRAFTPSEVSVSDFLDEWLDRYCTTNLKSTTVEGYRKRVKNYIKPVLGKYKLNSVTPAACQKLLDDMFNAGFSRNTLTSIKALMTGSFGYAVHPMGYIQTSPMVGVKIPSRRATPKNATQRKKTRRAITQEEWARLIARFPEGHPDFLPLMLGYHCGLRLGEAFGLSWDDIDLEAGMLYVRQQVQHIDGHWTLTPPKYDSYRKINLDRIMLDTLRRAHEQQIKYAAEYSEYYAPMYVNVKNQLVRDGFGRLANMVNVRPDGEYIQPRITQHLCKVAHKELDMPTFDFHTLRHTHTTMLIESGVSPVVVQNRLGHKNIQTTLDIYTTVTDTMLQGSVEILNQIYK